MSPSQGQVTAMRLILLIAVVIVLLGGLGGFVYLGAVPPRPHTRSVDKVLPNDQFPVTGH